AFRQRIADNAYMARRQNTPTIDAGPQDQMRARQLALVNQLQAQANGQGPSLAQGQLRQATNRNIQQQAGLALAQGGNQGLMQRQLANQAAMMNQDAAAQSAQLRAQEQLNARAQLAGALEAARGQDIGLASNNQQAALQQNQI